MDALLIALLGTLLAGYIPLVGYAFKTRADAAGWHTSYDREKDRADNYARAEERTAAAIAIGREVAKALGKLPPEASP